MVVSVSSYTCFESGCVFIFNTSLTSLSCWLPAVAVERMEVGKRPEATLATLCPPPYPKLFVHFFV